MAYESNVFINCPFDFKYRNLIERLIFILEFYGYNVQMSIAKSSTDDRISEISKMIEDSKFTIHDLSRHRSSKKGEYARFNMPFEFGIDFGCFQFGQNKQDKIIAVLDNEPHDYDIYLSDMSGRDILYHKDDPELLFEIIPIWLSRNTDRLYHAPKMLKGYYASWLIDYKRTLRELGYDLRGLRNLDLHIYIKILRSWIPGFKHSNGLA